MTPKDFQRATADRILSVFKNGQKRILLADEVGLGKTIIAREVIRQVSEWHKEDGDDHFKVIYICSNINIANQNAKKLGIKDLMKVSESRLSMQHLKIYQSKKNGHCYEQLIPLTPATSFSMTAGCGNQQERALMYAHLRRLPQFEWLQQELSVFMAHVAKRNWSWFVNYYEDQVVECDGKGSGYIEEMRTELLKRLGERPELNRQIIENCTYKGADRRVKSEPLINELRKIFAQISLEKLEPDLVVMDEFQRFRNLIADGDDEQAMLTQQFLGDTKTKVLLLSATPYKPYSTLEEISEDEDADHYHEFMEVMDFLFYDLSRKGDFHQVWRAYSGSLCEFSKDGLTILLGKKNAAEDALYKGICRTERFNSGIIDDSQAAEISITEGDILSYHDMQTLLEAINKRTNRRITYRQVPIDYIKSSPYLLSFMESYQLKRQITWFFDEHEATELIKAKKTKRLLLKRSQIHRYGAIAANNARLDKLKDVLFEKGRNKAENLLWIPPSKPYYAAGGVFERNQDFSKVLVFSAWEMVPRMIAVMLSYEAERLTIGKLFNNARSKRGRGYFATKEERRYGISRLKNETEDIVCHVSQTLAALYKPKEHVGKPIRQIRRELAEKLRPRLDAIQVEYGLAESGIAGAKAMVELIKALDHDEEANPSALPTGALDLMVNMAIGSPAICAYRMFGDRKLAKELAKSVFVKLFNKAESSAVLDLLYGRDGDDAYHENVFKYCVEGNLQAMLDEYAHVLDESGEQLLAAMSQAFVETSSLQVDTYEHFTGERKTKSRMRTHFASGYFNARLSDENVQRSETIRRAFNSPFRPFVLATTSIGQEGLDFHLYCRKIMHWNLPANPIDLEQREGRINRYKCLAVRQNIAHRYHEEGTWEAMFQKAAEIEKGENPDLVPFWSLTDGDHAKVKIERIVPMYPMSQDRLKYNRLIRVLALYRLTLGQPRQEELLEMINRESDGNIDKRLFMNLSPFYRQVGERSVYGDLD